MGLHLDKNLTWQPHIDSIFKKIRPIIAILPRLKNILPSKLKRSFYFSMIHSQLTYLNIVWGSCARYKLYDLLTLQKRAIKILFNLPFLTPTEELFMTTGFQSINSAVRFSEALYMHKVLGNHIDCNTKFPLVSSVHSIATRSQSQLVLPKIKTTKYTVPTLFYIF